MPAPGRRARVTAVPLDALTVLTTKGPLATKRITAGPYGPEIIDCDSAARFRFAVWPMTGFDSMAAALKRLQPLKRSLVVRGEPAEGVDWKDAPRRLRPTKTQPATLVAKARYWLP